MKRILATSIIFVLVMSLMSGCGTKKEDDNIVNISILNSKPEIAVALENVIEKFSEENKDINIKLVKYSESSSYSEKMNSMYAANNGPTITVIDSAHIRGFANNFLDLSNEEWIKDISGNISSVAKNNEGKVIAFPFATEGMGIIYNKKVMDEAGIDVNKINTIESLEEAFKKVESIGKKPLIISNEEWSLGDHFLSTAYSIETKKDKDVDIYFNNLKNGSINLKNSNTLNGLIDTFDIMKEYNMYAESPLLPSYDKCAEIIGKGDVGFWYMGNWASQIILNNSNGNHDFGFIPVPISNNASDYGNNEIILGVTKYMVIDKNNNSLEQQAAAKRFLNYLVYNENGNKFLVEDAGIIPAFNNIEVTQNDPLVNGIINYRESGKTMELMNCYLPSNNSQILGGALKKYLNNEINRDELITVIQEFWTENKE
jgi:raffinose/stachyose/melibiose transport system substrate-binding protein